MKRSGKTILLIILMTLIGAKGVAMEREGTILFVDEKVNQNYYYLDLDYDGLPDHRMNATPSNIGRLFAILSRYLEQPGTRIVFEDEGLEPNQNFNAPRMLGFYMSNGNYVRLDQIASAAEIQRFFPYLWAKIQAEQRRGSE